MEERDLYMSKTTIASSYIGSCLVVKIPPLKDTIDTDICEIDYIREFNETINERGGVDISFNLTNFGKRVRDSNYIFYNKASIDYDSRTTFVADWYSPFNRKRLKPNLDDAYTPGELYLSFGLDYFVNELTVHYKDGTSKNIVHIAGYIASVL